MDTRGKILTPEQAVKCARSVSANLIVGCFDVLQASTIGRLTSMARPEARLFAIVLHDPAAVLSLQARAELAAALRVIDYVIPLQNDPAELIAAIAPRELFRENDNHREAASRLIAHVRSRHQEPSH